MTWLFEAYSCSSKRVIFHCLFSWVFIIHQKGLNHNEPYLKAAIESGRQTIILALQDLKNMISAIKHFEII